MWNGWTRNLEAQGLANQTNCREQALALKFRIPSISSKSECLLVDALNNSILRRLVVTDGTGNLYAIWPEGHSLVGNGDVQFAKF